IRLKGDEVISQQFIEKAEEIINRLKVFEPIQYIMGETVFFDLPVKVTPDVLIPRPETEELVNWIISENKGKELRIMDIGTGSGCIALALAKNLPLAKVSAIDISEKALKIANMNAVRNNIEADFFRVDLLDPSSDLKGEYDIIVSNPPYVRDSEKRFMQYNVLHYEPHRALFVPDDNPLLFYKAIADSGNRSLMKNGCIYCEINETLSDETASVFQSRKYTLMALRKDINGKPRMLKAVKNHG
ncbi:MAG: peptide chain release factor N(5)-glutamine methyltransferase, partial [Bacteroidales bacterium]|nr:peptide chain release factor N(5)-glutamine methyltransferase [Bacteroidales bacterium]